MRSWEIIEEGRGGYGEDYERGREEYPREEYRRNRQRKPTSRATTRATRKVASTVTKRP